MNLIHSWTVNSQRTLILARTRFVDSKRKAVPAPGCGVDKPWLPEIHHKPAHEREKRDTERERERERERDFERSRTEINVDGVRR